MIKSIGWVKLVIIIFIIIILVKICNYESKPNIILVSTPVPTQNVILKIVTIKPTFPPPPDPYYDNITTKILEQKVKWQEELGWKQSMKKTVDWLNRKLPDYPLPPDIEEAIEGAELNGCNIRFTFKNGYAETICDSIFAPSRPSLKDIIIFSLPVLIIILFLTKRLNLHKRRKNGKNDIIHPTSISKQKKFDN